MRTARPASTWFLGVAAAAAVSGTAFMALSGNVDVDAAGCSPMLEGRTLTEFFVDRTDPMTAHQIQAFRKMTESAIAAAGACSTLAMFSLDKNWDGIAAPFFLATVPPRKQSESPSGATNRYLDREFQKKFRPKYEAMVESLSLPGTAPHSPIFEALNGMFSQPEFARATEGRHVIIFTDGLQNTDQFKEADNAAPDFRRLETPYFKAMKGDLRGTEISVYYLQRTGRDGKRQTARHRDFLRRWFEEQGAKVQAFVLLPP